MGFSWNEFPTVFTEELRRAAAFACSLFCSIPYAQGLSVVWWSPRFLAPRIVGGLRMTPSQL